MNTRFDWSWSTGLSIHFKKFTRIMSNIKGTIFQYPLVFSKNNMSNKLIENTIIIFLAFCFLFLYIYIFLKNNTCTTHMSKGFGKDDSYTTVIPSLYFMRNDISSYYLFLLIFLLKGSWRFWCGEIIVERNI